MPILTGISERLLGVPSNKMDRKNRSLGRMTLHSERG